jgi:hypothetical protein
MDTRHLIALILFPVILTSATAQVTVQIANPILEPGESTVVVVTVSNAIPECELQVFGVHTTGLVQFKDTTVRIPTNWPDELPFLISLPVQALPNVVAVWGQYLIVAEITGNNVNPGIIALSPGTPCSGNVSTGHTESLVTFSWEARGSFSSFEIIFYENPCGKYPPSTPTTPGTPIVPVPVTPTPATTTPSIPTTPTQPSLPNNPLPDNADWSGNEELPPLPPGWEWGPNGPHWTGQGSPELPPGWEWGPLRPVWTGTGQPPTTTVITTSPSLPCNALVTAPTIYSQTVNIAAFLQPGDAFVYQVYGVTETSGGHTTGALSQPVCDRYSPISGETGIPVEDTPCPYAGCTVSHEWVRKTPIKVTRPLECFPKGDALKEMIPGSCISFSVLANDVDLLKQICQGDAKCESTQPAIKRLGPYAHGVQYTWTKTGEGELKTICQNTIFYQTPLKFKKDEKKVAAIDVVLSNVDGKAADDPIRGKINITMTFVDSCKCIDARVKWNMTWI